MGARLLVIARRVCVLALCLAALSLVASSIPASATTTFAFVDATPHEDPTLLTQTVTVTGDASEIRLSMGPDNDFLWLRPRVNETLAVGTYANAKQFAVPNPLNADPGFFKNYFVRGCPLPGLDSPPVEATGRFIIDEVTYAGDGSVTSIAVRFEYHCDPYPVSVYGAVSFNASTVYPSHTFTPEPATIGPTQIGTVSAPTTVAVANSRSAPLTVNSVTLIGDDAAQFQIDASACLAGPITNAQPCNVSITFAPVGAPGTREAALLVYDTLVPLGGRGRTVEIQGVVPNATGEFTALTPARILDTRTTNGGHFGKVGGPASFDVQVAGRGGVPAADVLAVVLNVTVTEPTADSYLTVWPAGVPRPFISNLNFVASQTVPNLVTVAIGSSGKLGVYNNGGATHVIFDVVGYYSTSTGVFGSRFHGLFPFRYFDTRTGQGGVAASPLGANGTLKFKVTGKAGVPGSGVNAVVMNVTVTEPTQSSYLTVFPDDVSRPEASNLNFIAAQTVPNLVTVRVPASGIIDFYNLFGATHVVADVVGYYDGEKDHEAGRLLTGIPGRTFDSREASPFPPPGQLPPNGILVLQLNRDDVGSAILNVTVTEPTGSGYLTAFPLPPPPPLASNLNFTPGQTVPNLVIARVGFDRQIGFYNFGGSIHLVVDVFGFFTNNLAIVPADADADADTDDSAAAATLLTS